MTVPAQTSPRTAQHTLLATRHSALIIPDSLDESPTLWSPACRVLTAESLVSQHLTPSHLQVIPTGIGRSRPDSPDVVLLGNADNDSSEEDLISLSCFSKSDTVKVRVAAVREKAHRSDVLYAAWLDVQIHEGNDEVK